MYLLQNTTPAFVFGVNRTTGNIEKWTISGFYPVSSKGDFEIELKKENNSILTGAYEYRAVLLQDGLKSPGLTLRASETTTAE